MNKDNHPAILVTGANGQLGNEIKRIAASYPGFSFQFTGKQELPIDDFLAVKKYFSVHPLYACINCAAYTAVDKAETEKEQAFSINAIAAGKLAEICTQYNVLLIHISTDYVFNGFSVRPYMETDETSPLNYYGASKLSGERLVFEHNPRSVVIRSSWLYSAYGNNFVKTMIRLMKEKETINVVNDQTGCPTNIADLARFIMEVIIQLPEAKCDPPFIFNFSNKGSATWYEFALAIKTITKSNCIINPIPSGQFHTSAKRPAYSVLDTSKIQKIFHTVIPDWKASLQKCLEEAIAS